MIIVLSTIVIYLVLSTFWVFFLELSIKSSLMATSKSSIILQSQLHVDPTSEVNPHAKDKTDLSSILSTSLGRNHQMFKN